MLPWFRAIEHDAQFPNADHHGDSGPITINRHPRENWYPLLERFAEAAIARGYDWVDDHNAPGAIGVGPTPFNMIDGARQTPADHYLDPAFKRSNLALMAGVTIDRIVLENGKARRVEWVDTDGETGHLEADRVIVCLGTYSSPALLLRSGIGPAEKIAPHGISVVHELPAVGEAMQDHPKISYRFWIDTEIPQWPHPWIQVLLTAMCEVGGQERLFQPHALRGNHRGRAFVQ